MFSLASVDIYVYMFEQLPGANFSPIVTKLRQSYPWLQGTGCCYMLEGQGQRSRSVGEVCALLNALLVF